MIISSSTEEPSLSPQDIIVAISEPLFQFYTMGTAIVLFALYRYSSTETGQKYVIVDLLISSLMGGYTVLSIKALSSLLRLDYSEALQHSITYWLILVAVITGAAQINYVNKSLSRFSSTIVMPTNFVLFSTFSIVGSSVLYNDLSHTSPWALVGVLFMFMGVYVITTFDEYSPVSQLPTDCISEIVASEPIEEQQSITIPVNINSLESSPLLNSFGNSALLSTTSSPTRRPDLRDKSDRAFKSLSFVLEAANGLGTHVIRKMEIDALSEIQARSPGK